MKNDERYNIADDNTNDKKEPRNRFPVRAQILSVVVILSLLFINTIIDKTSSIFAVEDNDKLQKNTQAQDVYVVKKELEEDTTSIDEVDIRAKSAYVWDVKEQRVLFEKNATEKLPLASITKLMTTLVAYELVPENTKVKISKTASMQESGGNLREGERFKVKLLADFALVSSYNSAAYALADSVGRRLGDRDPVSQFVAGMNIRAEELGLENTQFHNPTGLDISEEKAGAYGTAKEVSMLMEYILTNYPEILSPTMADSTRLYNIAGQYHDAHNTNDILSQLPNLMGSKTGYTDLAGGNLTVALDMGLNHPVVITVLGSTITERFSDVKELARVVRYEIADENNI